MKYLLPILFALLLVSVAAAQNTSIQNSPHNLSASGPGAIRASGEQEICIFCHTPHNSAPIQPLWNRATPVQAYTVYSSNSLQANVGQPTGSSKLCLSCHDGTIALGSVLSRTQQIQMVGGITTLPPGASNLGTDLSDDHPISFRYDSYLSSKDTKVKDPSLLPRPVRLDSNGEVQCTSCHDAHNDQWGKFLVMDNSQSQLCNSCHNEGPTTVAAHSNCSTCHKPHTAPSGPYLLAGKTVTETCLPCHGSTNQSPQGANVALAMNKLSKHDTNSPVNLKDHIPANIVCNDCHEPHTMNTGTASAPNLSPKLGAVAGVNAAGAATPRAQFEYELCFKCHSTQGATVPYVSRQIVQNNTMLEFAPSAVSFHPVEVAGKGMDVPSLRGNVTTASLIYCSDCHSSDTGSAAGGTGASGPHGSNYRPLLAMEYDVADLTAESATAYALCYKCHDRASILANQSFSDHSHHIVDQKTPCSVCHDAHGIASAQGTATNHAHLINFDTSVVQPDAVSHKIEYRSTGVRTGECTLSCHGVEHSAKTYPGGPAGVMQLRSAPALRRAAPVAPAAPKPAAPIRRPQVN